MLCKGSTKTLQYRRIFWGATKMLLRFTEVGVSMRTRDEARVVCLVQTFVMLLLPGLTYTARSIVRGDGCAPMHVYNHREDNHPLSSVVAVADFRGGGHLTTIWMGGGEGRVLHGCTTAITFFSGAIFNAWGMHGTERWGGERFAYHYRMALRSGTNAHGTLCHEVPLVRGKGIVLSIACQFFVLLLCDQVYVLAFRRKQFNRVG